MKFFRRVLLVAGIVAAIATIAVAVTQLITWFNPPTQSKESTPAPAQPVAQPAPVIIVQTPAPVVIMQAAEPTQSIPNTYYSRPGSETTSAPLVAKETRVESQPSVAVPINAHSNVSPNPPPLSEASLALLNAVAVGNHDRVKQGLAWNADPNAAHADGRTPLMLCAANGHRDICKTLLEARAVVTKTDLRGRTALHYAAAGGHNDLVQFLLGRGALAEIVDSDGKTALDLALENGHETCARVIREFRPQ